MFNKIPKSCLKTQQRALGFPFDLKWKAGVSQLFPFPSVQSCWGGGGEIRGGSCECQGYVMGCKTKRKKKNQNKPKIHLPGIHYVGQMQEGSIIRFMVDQLTEGQLEWAQLPAVYDTVVLGEPGSGRTYRIYSGKEEYFQRLKEQFPGEGAAIDEFERLVKVKGALASPQGGDGGFFWLWSLSAGVK